jgi:hypothetical protein
MEMRVVLREVLNRVELRPASDQREIPRLAGITLIPRTGTRVSLAPT